jgi:peptidylprolyl isomerase
VRCLGLIAALCMALALAGCGGDSSSAESERPAKPTKPEIEPPSKPPAELVIDDIEEGSGREAEDGDIMTMHYYAVDKDGKELYSSWDYRPTTYELGSDDFFPAWDEAVEGMKVGGRREMQFPSDLAFGWGPVYYVVDLLELE